MKLYKGAVVRKTCISTGNPVGPYMVVERCESPHVYTKILPRKNDMEEHLFLKKRLVVAKRTDVFVSDQIIKKVKKGLQKTISHPYKGVNWIKLMEEKIELIKMYGNIEGPVIFTILGVERKRVAGKDYIFVDLGEKLL